MVVEFSGPDGDGYAVCSGDKRYEQVFAYVPYGDLSDTVNNPTLGYFYKSVEYSINDSIAKFNSIVDSLTNLGYKYEYPNLVKYSDDDDGPINPLPPGMIYLGKYFDVEKEGNAQLNMKMQWGQGYPYNDSMAEKSGFYMRDPINLRALAGCTSIALGQAMAYKKSSYYPFITSKWNAIRELKTIEGTEYASDVALFIAALGEDTYVKYGMDGTTTSWMYISDFFDVKGIKYESIERVRYDTATDKEKITNFIFNSCNNKNPVIVHAKDTQQGFEHAFIIHGVDFKQGMYYEVIGTEPPDGGGMNKMYRLLEYKYDLYVQINWGWNGRGDGRFYWNQFKVLNDNYDYITMLYTFQ